MSLNNLNYENIQDYKEMLNIRDSLELFNPNWKHANHRIIKLLYDKYKDEQILCLSYNLLPKDLVNNFKYTTPSYLLNFIKLLQRIPRNYAEHNPLYLKVVIHTVDYNENGYLIYGDDFKLLGKSFILSFKDFSQSNIIYQPLFEYIKNMSSLGILYNENDPIKEIGIVFLNKVNSKEDTMNLEQLKNNIDKFDNCSKIIINNLKEVKK